MAVFQRIAGTAAFAAALVTALPLPAAFAEWSVDVSHDASGHLKVAISGDLDGTRSIYATCDTTRSALLAVIMPANDPMLSTTGMSLIFTFADGTRWTSGAALYRYDADRVAVGYGNSNDVPAIVSALASAQNNVQVGVGLGGQVRTWSADVKGSTAAARKFLDNCFPTN